MPSLLELQRGLRAALLAANDASPPAMIDGTVIVGAIIGGMPDALARVRVYRNNVVGNLAKALRLAFPAVERLVGAEFFAGTAAHFISVKPPRGADLYEYGADFPEFLATFAPARGIAYLADVARLEWAVNLALHAPIAPAVTADALLGIPASRQPDLRFTPHPSLSLLALSFPAKEIWEVVMTDDTEARARRLGGIDIAAAGDVLAVLRGDDGLALLRLSPAAHGFARCLTGGQCLADALDAVPSADAAPLLGGLIAHGLFGRCYLPGDLAQQHRGFST